MAEKEYLIDDRNIISEDINKMTREELQAEIEKIEAEAAKRKKKTSA